MAPNFGEILIFLSSTPTLNDANPWKWLFFQPLFCAHKVMTLWHDFHIFGESCYLKFYSGAAASLKRVTKRHLHHNKYVVEVFVNNAP